MLRAGLPVRDKLIERNDGRKFVTTLQVNVEQRGVEFVPKGTSKATGIEWLCNHLDIPLDETYAIGDSVNDLEMLESVGHGIAMGNSMPPVKEIAEYVTSDISDDGVKNALKHYGLI